MRNAEGATNDFLQVLEGLGGTVGATFLQLSDNFSPKGMADLKTYLEHLPKDLPLFLEVRHKEWFANPDIRNNYFELLRELNFGAAITDAPGRRDCVHMTLPTPNAYVRFVGSGDQVTDIQHGRYHHPL